MAGSGAGLIKGNLRSRMEQVLLEDDHEIKEKQVINSKKRERTDNLPREKQQDDYRERKRYQKVNDD